VAAFDTLARSGWQPRGALVEPQCSRCRRAEESSVTAGFTRVGARAALDTAARTGVLGCTFMAACMMNSAPLGQLGMACGGLAIDRRAPHNSEK
jgi:hypothetical protein